MARARCGVTSVCLVVLLLFVLPSVTIKPVTAQEGAEDDLGDLGDEDLGDYSDMDPYGSDLGEDEGGGDDKPSSHLTGFIDIDDKTVDKVLGKFAGSMHVFLELFADWCSACQQLKPELEEVAQEYGDHPTLLLAKADAQSNPLISARFNVTAFPTIKFRRKGSSTWEDYEGERDAASINELLGDVAGEVGTVDAMQPHAKTFRSSSQKQSVKSTAEQTISTLDETEASNAQYYVKAMDKALSKGDEHFKNEYKRLKRIVDAGDMRPDKQSEFKRKMGILKQFMSDAEKNEARSEL